MSEPIYDTDTERIYQSLPEFYRVFDARSENNYALKKYLSSIAGQLDEINSLIARLEYIPPEERADWLAAQTSFTTYQRPAGIEDPALGWEPIGYTSDLFDGRTANDEWLPWVAQIIGADISFLTTEVDQRDAIIENFLGYRAGSRAALEAAVKAVLTGTKFVRIYPHRDGAGGSLSSFGDMWDILIVTKEEETPNVADIVDEVLRKRAKPAGVVLHHIAYNVTWDMIETLFPTWTALEAAGNWDNIELGNADLLPIV